MNAVAALLARWGQLMASQATITNTNERAECAAIGRALTESVRNLATILGFVVPYLQAVDLGSSPGNTRPVEPLVIPKLLWFSLTYLKRISRVGPANVHPSMGSQSSDTGAPQQVATRCFFYLA